jgi:hypothetical protein
VSAHVASLRRKAKQFAFRPHRHSTDDISNFLILQGF